MTQANTIALRSILPSLIATPWLILVSTASALYLKNQTDLYYRYEVLYPFLGAALLIYCIGVLIALSVKQIKSLMPVLWAYYLIVPVFIISQNAAVEPYASLLSTRIVLLIAIFVGAIFFLPRKITLSQAAPIFTLIGCAFILLDGYKFMSHFEPYESAYTREANNDSFQAGGKKQPNIYHIILDEYQVDMFMLTLSPKIKEQFSGFTLFRDAAAVFGRTEMSLPSIFSGMNYDFESSPIDYQKAAFANDNSLFSVLKDHEYETRAVIHPVFNFDLEGFDSVAFHQQVRQPDYESVNESFIKLWAFSTLPESFIARVIEPVDLDQLKHKNLLTTSAPIESYESMLNTTAAERSLRESNRYQFVHLLLPHFPYVLSENCRYKQDGSTSALAQAQCATKLTIDFMETLKNLGRFDDSMIVIQSDHGARFEIVDGKLRGLGESDPIRFGTKWSRARSRALLLIKPAGVGADTEFSISDMKVSLLDVAPTIINALGLSSEKVFDGRAILAPEFTDTDRQRYYYFYNKKDAKGKHLVRMTRFRVEDAELLDEGLVKSGEFN